MIQFIKKYHEPTVQCWTHHSTSSTRPQPVSTKTSEQCLPENRLLVAVDPQHHLRPDHHLDYGLLATSVRNSRLKVGYRDLLRSIRIGLRPDRNSCIRTQLPLKRRGKNCCLIEYYTAPWNQMNE